MKTLFFVFSFLFLFTFLNSTIINVPADQPTIQAGITAAANTDTVLVQPGAYLENINYNGKLITVGSLYLTTLDTTYISSTIIDGNSNDSVVTFNHNENSIAVLCGFTITNGSSQYGSGICIYCSSPDIQNVIIADNICPAGIPGVYMSGGGIYCSNSNLSLKNVTISGNVANVGGGIFCSNSSSQSLVNVTISGNSACTYGGGGIYYYNSSPSLENVTISGNFAISGGGIYCTVNSNPSLINSILWNNTPEEIYIQSGSVTATYSDIQGGWTGTGNINSDPLFVNSGSGDYHLQSISPCIDAGDPVSPYDPDGTITDMGAFYFDQTIILDPPQNVMLEIIDSEVHISWDAVTGAISYKVYSSDDPYTGFVEDTSGSFIGESWSTSIINEKKFYYIRAIN